MKSKAFLFIAFATILWSFQNEVKGSEQKIERRFNIEKDLLLVHFDCKTDVDDLQTAAALATLVADIKYSRINYHAVAGTYGIQGVICSPKFVDATCF
jgi:hypothetical protein